MKKMIFLVPLLYSIHGASFAQTTMTHGQFIEDSIRIITPHIIRPQIRLDSRQSVFEGHPISIYGYDAGILAKDKLKLALGYYRMNNNLPIKKEIDSTETNLSLAIDCGTLNTELMFYNSRYLLLGFPLEIGVGQYRLNYHDAKTKSLISKQQNVLAFANFALSLTFKPFRFIGLKGMAGYRKSIYPNENVLNFSGVFSSISLVLDMQDATKNFKMYRLKKKYYGKDFRGFETFVDLMTN